ncbi:hypothetical protein P4O66_004371 [Electrophorus voltai]|uniref:Uncharacterized protein n=1 Tax=Electrophorus voltai TaxID=2609070 RepID=A0AAD9E2M2_9TELE|nr:hypothetical protein P4O66_004371 [Electrophorus voltai]
MSGRSRAPSDFPPTNRLSKCQTGFGSGGACFPLPALGPPASQCSAIVGALLGLCFSPRSQRLLCKVSRRCQHCPLPTSVTRPFYRSLLKERENERVRVRQHTRGRGAASLRAAGEARRVAERHGTVGSSPEGWGTEQVTELLPGADALPNATTPCGRIFSVPPFSSCVVLGVWSLQRLSSAKSNIWDSSEGLRQTTREKEEERERARERAREQARE